MLIVRTISARVVGYYLDGRDPGAWTPGATRLLGLSGPVEPGGLRSVLGGRHPDSGRFLPAVRPARRRAGWDLIFSAPKSVSLMARGPSGADVEAAHRAAVGGVLARLEDRLSVYRAAAPGHLLPAGGLIGARFEHRANAGAEPHLHTHLLIANLTRTSNGWSAVRGTDWYLGRRSLAALYQLALRHELALRGWDLEWRMRDDGLADVASVPRAVIRSVSTSRRPAGVGTGPAPPRPAAPRPGTDRVTDAGWDGSPGPAGGAVAPARREPGLDEPALAGQVAGRLAVRRSDFGANDVIVALASRLPAGAPVAEAAEWADRFCVASLPVPSPTAGPRWTTAIARAADDRLVRLLDEMAARAGPDRGHLAVVAAGEGLVTVLGCRPGHSDLIAQAELIRIGLGPAGPAGTAAVAAPTGPAATRWAVLTGLPAYRPGGRAGVVVVDQADRRSTGELLRLVEAARASSARLVLVEGGTLPRLSNFASHGLADFADRSGAVTCPRPVPWTASRAAGPAAQILSRWVESGRQAVLVGLGLEEVRGLNAAARRLTTGASDRGNGLVAGDRVVVLRRGDGRPAYASLGRITQMDPDARRVVIRWDGSARPETYGRQVLSGLGPGWALTPHLAARAGRPVMLLGPASAVPRLRPLLRASVEVEPAGRGRSMGLGD